MNGEKVLSVNIPAGVDDGTRIRLSGEGESGSRGGPAGDLYIFIHLKQHALFERNGTTLLARAPVSFTTAALGGTIEVPGIDRKPCEIQIRPGRSEEHTSELQSLMRISYADFCLKHKSKSSSLCYGSLL